MRKPFPIVHVWRVVFEAATPLSITSGFGDGVDDSRVVLAPNGLPSMPATALAGVLRHAARRHFGAATEQQLFGFASGDTGAVSRVEISQGVLHDSRDQPVESLMLQDRADPLLQPLLEQLSQQRRRVRIGHRGTAEQGAHFDRALLPAGHRFSVEISLWGTDRDDQDASMLMGLLRSPSLRLGGLTRSGLGRLTVQGLVERRFDLRDPGDLADYAKLGTTRAAVGLLHEPRITPALSAMPGLGLACFDLVAEGPIRVGGGRTPLTRHGGKPADDLPYTEPRVMATGPGRRELRHDCVVVPATAIKGALAHRTAFHDRRLRGLWAGSAKSQASLAVTSYFGSVSSATGGRAGAVFIDDIWVQDLNPKLEIGVAMHNSGDRFTGGVRAGALYSAENLYNPRLPLCIEVDFDAARRSGADPCATQALCCAFDDLAQGRLTIGADAASGLGYLQGRYHWSGARPPLKRGDLTVEAAA